MKKYDFNYYLHTFQPENNIADNYILYQITGRRKSGEACDFSDSTDGEDTEYVSYESQYTNNGRRKTSKFKVKRATTFMTTDEDDESSVPSDKKRLFQS